MSSDLRHLVAEAHGLSPEAAKLLVGETLTELEESATALAALIEEHRPQREEQPPDLLAAAAKAKAERKQALLDALTGRTPQARDQQGRFVSGLDGGARTTPQRQETHAETLARVLRDGSADVGAALET